MRPTSASTARRPSRRRPRPACCRRPGRAGPGEPDGAHRAPPSDEGANGASVRRTRPPRTPGPQRPALGAGRDRLVGARRAGRVAPEPELGERAVEGIEQQQAADERLADPEQDLEHLVGLEHPHDPGHDAQDAGHGAAGRELGRRRGRIQAAVARALVRHERRQLALEPEHAGVDDRDARRHGRVVEQVAGLERVGPVEDHVVAGDDPLDVVRDEHLVVGDDVDVGVEREDRLPRRIDLLLADPLGRVDDLALEVGQVDDVEVDDPDRAHAGRREVERRGRPRPPAPTSRTFESSSRAWPSAADLGDQQVAAVADLLLGVSDRRRLPRQALGASNAWKPPVIEATFV